MSFGWSWLRILVTTCVAVQECCSRFPTITEVDRSLPKTSHRRNKTSFPRLTAFSCWAFSPAKNGPSPTEPDRLTEKKKGEGRGAVGAHQRDAAPHQVGDGHLRLGGGRGDAHVAGAAPVADRHQGLGRSPTREARGPQNGALESLKLECLQGKAGLLRRN